MSLPGHGASGSVQLHGVFPERGEMEAFLLQEEKFPVADASCSSERRNPTTRQTQVLESWLGLGVDEQSWGWTRQFGEIP